MTATGLKVPAAAARPSSGPAITRGTIGDLDAVIEVHSSGWGSPPPELTVRQFRHHLRRGELWTAWAGGVLVGTISLADTPYHDWADGWPTEEPALYCDHLVVRPGTMTGNTLMDFACSLAAATGRHCLRGTVRPDRPRVITWYQRSYGVRIVGSCMRHEPPVRRLLIQSDHPRRHIGAAKPC
ncbi:hypothetical protein ACFW7J_21320 [Streptomyces sp. NPDC059525]|uniref:hypothetical protein n=1 Tax=Streptomyces sp. NPDC059525 TaxID=3346857 RepID=UPI0036757FB6